MKKNMVMAICASLILSGTVQAQYKKASFLNKTGRIYEIGTAYHAGNSEIKGAPGIFVSLGKENSEKRIHHWYDMGLILPADYTFIVPSNFINVPTATLTGRTGISYFFRYNFGVFLLKNSRESKNKVIPYMKASLGYADNFSPNRDYNTTPENANPVKIPNYRNECFTFGGGVGLLYRVTDKIGIRLSGDYDARVLTNSDNREWYIPLIINHPSVSLAVRFHMYHNDE